MKAIAPKDWLAETGSFYSSVHGYKRKRNEDFIKYNFRGLKNIYLRNGYTLHNEGDGVFARVEKPWELEKAIVLALVESDCPLSAEAFRFLRRTVSMTRSEIALLLGIKARDVLMWEYQAKEIPVAAELVIRALAKEHYSGFAELALTVSVISRFKKQAEVDIHLEYANDRWSVVED